MDEHGGVEAGAGGRAAGLPEGVGVGPDPHPLHREGRVRARDVDQRAVDPELVNCEVAEPPAAGAVNASAVDVGKGQVLVLSTRCLLPVLEEQRRRQQQPCVRLTAPGGAWS